IYSLNFELKCIALKLRAVKSEIEELEEVEKERDKFYELKISEMNEFRENVKRFLTETRTRVQELRNSVNELKSTFMELPGNNGYMSSSEIAEAEMKRAELLAMKESLTKTLASNHQRRAELQKQVENMLVARSPERWKPIQSGNSKGV
ncbi:hypothetical protein Goklo_003672, partial [Gossypium klotzschianum]|nr:hypothetical protein [Gossypium klotzschianum]